MATDAELHAAGEFHDPASCPECNRSGPKRAFIGFDGARRVDGPVPVAFIAPDGTTTVMQAESVTVHYDPEPWIPAETWDACADPHAEQALPKEIGPE